MHFLVFLPQKRKTFKKIKKTFKNPLTNRQENSIIDKLNTVRPVGQAVKTLASHAENMGSIPVRVTNDRKQDISPAFSFSVVGDPYAHQTQHLAQSATVHGFETLLRRFRVGSLAWRSKFPYTHDAFEILSIPFAPINRNACKARCTLY